MVSFVWVENWIQNNPFFANTDPSLVQRVAEYFEKDQGSMLKEFSANQKATLVKYLQQLLGEYVLRKISSSMKTPRRFQKGHTMNRLTWVAAALLLGCSAAWAGTFEEGVAAQDRGDYTTAFNTFRQLAAQGDAASQFRLSLLYNAGQGVVPDRKEALRWLLQAAQRGNAQAQSNLGVAYSKGRGVAQDPLKAYAWFSLAAQSGSPDALTNRDVAAARMTPQQLVQAKAMVQECQTGNFKACE